MKLISIQLENFRNYRRLNFEFNENKPITILLGPNGKGKTNMLEAIYLLSLGKSFRTSVHDDLIDWEMDYLRCSGEMIADKEKTNLEVFYSNYPRKQKGLKRNDMKLKNSEYLGTLLTVLFHPEDLNMLYLSPSLRRRYLDIILSQTDKKYLLALTNYKKTLKQRNALLKEIREAKFKSKETSKLLQDLDAWDRELIKFGTEIIEKRIALTEFLDERIEKIYQKISGDKERIEVEYKCRIIKNNRLTYSDELFNHRDRDIYQAKTTAGPHRDDLRFFLKGKEISHSASRGEFRTLLLALKLAEIDYIKQKTGKNPILLLDDVFSELDIDRSEHLIKAIEGVQTIITATDLKSLIALGENKNTNIVKIEKI